MNAATPTAIPSTESALWIQLRRNARAACRRMVRRFMGKVQDRINNLFEISAKGKAATYRPCGALAAWIASWQALAAVNTLLKAGSARNFASNGSDKRFECAQ